MEELEKKATPGPWESWDNYLSSEQIGEDTCNDKIIAEFYSYSDGYGDSCSDTELLATLRNEAPTLIEMLKIIVKHPCLDTKEKLASLIDDKSKGEK